MLRGLNSIYLQAPHITSPQDISDFLFLISSWATWVSHHHALEEEIMFPGFERVLGVEGLLKSNVDQHHTFQPALQELLEYSQTTEPGEYRGEEVRGLVERLAPAFQGHLRDEIDTLLAMQRYAGDAGKGEALLEVYKAAEAEAGKQDKVCRTLSIPRPPKTLYLMLNC
jgi:hemerythrin-like domain-containing protein